MEAAPAEVELDDSEALAASADDPRSRALVVAAADASGGRDPDGDSQDPTNGKSAQDRDKRSPFPLVDELEMRELLPLAPFFPFSLRAASSPKIRSKASPTRGTAGFQKLRKRERIIKSARGIKIE